MKWMHILVVAIALCTVSCSKDVKNPPGEEDHEAINSVSLIFRQGAVVTGTYSADDPDGDGGNPPVKLDTIKLLANQTYSVEILIRNINNSGTTNITEMIKDEGNEHQLYYLPSTAQLNILTTDKDVNNLPLGIKTTWTAIATSRGGVLVKLMHKPGIKAAGDDPDKGATDLAVTFPVVIL